MTRPVEPAPAKPESGYPDLQPLTGWLVSVVP